MQVLTSAAQRVTQEMSQSISSSSAEQVELYKQQHVLTKTANAFDSMRTGQTPESADLAIAAHQVVLQAATTVLADRTAAAAATAPACPPQAALQQVTVNEVSVATQDAVAKAVARSPTSSDVNIIRTAATILQEQRTPPAIAPALAPAPEPARSLSAGSSSSLYFPPVSVSSLSGSSPPSLSDYAPL